MKIDPINVGHSDLYFIVQLFRCIMRASNFSVIGKAGFRRATLSCDRQLLYTLSNFNLKLHSSCLEGN